MTAYQGGKGRLGKRIYTVLKMLEEELSDKELPYFEPFIGMAGVMRHFAAENRKQLFASDANKDLILMWREVQKGWKPPLKCSKAEYERLRHDKPSAKRAFIGIVASYGTVLFNGYRLDYNKEKDYLREGYNGLMAVAPVMRRVKFLDSASYDEWNPKGHLIYCDPPYLNNKLKNEHFVGFDHTAFWELMRKWSKRNIVVVSEAVAPKDWKCVWAAESNCSTRHGNKVYKDCLFLHGDVAKTLSPRVKAQIKKVV